MSDAASDRFAAFGGQAARYDAWYEEHELAYEAERSAVREVLGEGREGLEIGAGTGRFGTRVGVEVGVEPARSMALRARGRGMRVVQGVGERLPFADGSFDRVLAVAVVAFLAEPRRALAEARRVLAPEGRLVVAFLDRGSPLGADRLAEPTGTFAAEGRFRTAVEVAQLLEETGFELQAARQTLFDPLDEIERAPEIREGCGEGLFAVLAGSPRRVPRRR